MNVDKIKQALESAQSELRDWHYDHPVHKQIRDALTELGIATSKTLGQKLNEKEYKDLEFYRSVVKTENAKLLEVDPTVVNPMAKWPFKGTAQAQVVPEELTPMLLLNAAVCIEQGDNIIEDKRDAVAENLIRCANLLRAAPALQTARAAIEADRDKRALSPAADAVRVTDTHTPLKEMPGYAEPIIFGKYSIRDYHVAPSGEGPKAFEWTDKPHRLLYDLCRALLSLRSASRGAA